MLEFGENRESMFPPNFSVLFLNWVASTQTKRFECHIFTFLQVTTNPCQLSHFSHAILF